MKPELSPPSLTRKAGSSLREGLHNLSILLSLIEASSWTAIDKKSRAYKEGKCDERSLKKPLTPQKNPYEIHKHSYLSWVFAMEISTWNCLASLCKNHLGHPSRKKTIWNLNRILVTIWGRSFFTRKRIQGCQWHCLFLYWWCSEQNLLCHWRLHEPVYTNTKGMLRFNQIPEHNPTPVPKIWSVPSTISDTAPRNPPMKIFLFKP